MDIVAIVNAVGLVLLARLTNSLFSVSSFMMLAMTGVEEVLADETSFIEDTDASFFFVPFSFSYVNVYYHRYPMLSRRRVDFTLVSTSSSSWNACATFPFGVVRHLFSFQVFKIVRQNLVYDRT